jgi:hypothetical protein
VVDSAGRDSDQIFFGATVRLKDKTITIVGVDETDTAKGRISWISPVAKALIKAREGDRVAAEDAGRCGRIGDTRSSLRTQSIEKIAANFSLYLAQAHLQRRYFRSPSK